MPSSGPSPLSMLMCSAVLGFIAFGIGCLTDDLKSIVITAGFGILAILTGGFAALIRAIESRPRN